MEYILLFFGVLFALFVGLAIGSFSTMVYWRLPEREVVSGKWMKGKRAHCVECGVKLRTRELLPVFNWLITKGKCLSCKTPINPVYFFIEFGCAMASLIAFLQFGFSDRYVLVFAVAVTCIIIAATHYTYRKIPSQLLVSLCFTSLLYRVYLERSLMDVLSEFAVTVLVMVGIRHIYTKGKQQKRFVGDPYLISMAATSLALPPFLFIPYAVSIGALYYVTVFVFPQYKRYVMLAASALFVFGVYCSPLTVLIYATN
ncbi:MAG: prepilin peptidase [Proteobacteria bacterium]|nr:prepilin peptidase [Pseudomonadota bacterium]